MLARSNEITFESRPSYIMQ